MIFKTLTELLQQHAEKRALERKRIDTLRADIERQVFEACEQAWEETRRQLEEVNNCN